MDVLGSQEGLRVRPPGMVAGVRERAPVCPLVLFPDPISLSLTRMVPFLAEGEGNLFLAPGKGGGIARAGRGGRGPRNQARALP